MLARMPSVKSLLTVISLAVASGAAFAQNQPQPTGWVVEDNSIGVIQQPVAVQPQPAPPAPPPNWAVAAMLALNPKYVGGIVDVTASGGTPEPKQWIILARDTSNQGVLHRLTVADGQVIADVPSLNLVESMRQRVSIDPQAVQVDSGDAYLVVEPIAAANGKIIGHVDYSLHQEASDTGPIWTLNCFDLNGVYIGKVNLLATTGNVLSSPGFKNVPGN